jgi:hypothetical protein
MPTVLLLVSRLFEAPCAVPVTVEAPPVAVAVSAGEAERCLPLPVPPPVADAASPLKWSVRYAPSADGHRPWCTHDTSTGRELRTDIPDRSTEVVAEVVAEVEVFAKDLRVVAEPEALPLAMAEVEGGA